MSTETATPHDRFSEAYVNMAQQAHYHPAAPGMESAASACPPSNCAIRSGWRRKPAPTLNGFSRKENQQPTLVKHSRRNATGRNP